MNRGTVEALRVPSRRVWRAAHLSGRTARKRLAGMLGAVMSQAIQSRCWHLGIDLRGTRIRLDWPEGLQLGNQPEFSLPPARCVVHLSEHSFIN